MNKISKTVTLDVHGQRKPLRSEIKTGDSHTKEPKETSLPETFQRHTKGHSQTEWKLPQSI